MEIVVATERNAELWDSFVEKHPSCTNYHRWAWKHVIEQAFRWPTYYLYASENGAVKGILPLVWQNSFIFGNLLCSLPFLSRAGVAATDQKTAQALLEQSVQLARRLKAEYIELRQNDAAFVSWPSKTNKVTLVCDVYPDSDQNMQRLPTKMRTNVRRSLKTGFEVDFGGKELLDDFYEVFCVRMRELGTPVYSLKFFEAILQHFPNEAFVCRVRDKGKIVGAAFMTGYGETMEANWSASDPAAISLRPNMYLFWELQCFAGRKGYRIFDFGRSSVNSGTYQFKLQWNAKPVQLYWNYWIKSGEPALELNPENSRYRIAISIWKKLPLPMTKVLGPPIARCLP